jgi:hypothetical protein
MQNTPKKFQGVKLLPLKARNIMQILSRHRRMTVLIIIVLSILKINGTKELKFTSESSIGDENIITKESKSNYDSEDSDKISQMSTKDSFKSKKSDTNFDESINPDKDHTEDFMLANEREEMKYHTKYQGLYGTEEVWKALAIKTSKNKRKTQTNHVFKWEGVNLYENEYGKELIQSIKTKIKASMENFLTSVNSEGKPDEVVKIDKSQYGEGPFANKDLNRGEVIGLFNGLLYTETEDYLIGRKRRSYLMSIDMPITDEPGKTILLYIDPFEKSGKVNDCRKNIHSKHKTTDDEEQQNMIWMNFTYDGLKYIAEVIVKNVRKGQEILTYYGEEYQISERPIIFPQSSLFELLLKKEPTKEDIDQIKKSKKAMKYNYIHYSTKINEFRCSYSDFQSNRHTVSRGKHFEDCQRNALFRYKNNPHAKCFPLDNIAECKKELEINNQIELLYLALEIEEKYQHIKEHSKKCSLYNNIHYRNEGVFQCTYSETDKDSTRTVFTNRFFGKCIIGCQYMIKHYPEKYKYAPENIAQPVTQEVLNERIQFQDKETVYNTQYDIPDHENMNDEQKKMQASRFNNICYKKNQKAFVCTYRSKNKGGSVQISSGNTLAKCVLKCLKIIEENPKKYNDARDRASIATLKIVDESEIKLIKQLETEYNELEKIYGELEPKDQAKLYYRMFYHTIGGTGGEKKFQCVFGRKAVTNINLFHCLAGCQKKFEGTEVGKLKSKKTLKDQGHTHFVDIVGGNECVIFDDELGAFV